MQNVEEDEGRELKLVAGVQSRRAGAGGDERPVRKCYKPQPLF